MKIFSSLGIKTEIVDCVNVRRNAKVCLKILWLHIFGHPFLPSSFFYDFLVSLKQISSHANKIFIFLNLTLRNSDIFGDRTTTYILKVFLNSTFSREKNSLNSRMLQIFYSYRLKLMIRLEDCATFMVVNFKNLNIPTSCSSFNMIRYIFQHKCSFRFFPSTFLEFNFSLIPDVY